jgi:energy-coupling factor transporter ATP-binding protein EcfA2
MKLTLENVRGFEGKHELHVKPVTLVVGENSSGKTTLLAALSAALQPDFPTVDVLNRAPFELGSFDTIATYRGGAYGRASKFCIGWESEASDGHSIRAEFSSNHGVPRVSRVEVHANRQTLVGSPVSGEWKVTYGSEKSPTSSVTFRTEASEAAQFSLSDAVRLYLAATRASKRGKEEGDPRGSDEALQALFNLTASSPRHRPRVTALAPLRTRPRRTYDELIEEFKPEGDHVPLVLARILADEGQKDGVVANALDAFGKASGLFNKIKVKRMGRQPSDPFQVRVKSAGPDANLVDVGYGVSQALPIIVDSILAPKNRVVLVQQPEVHLHPKAQAALGSFFCELARDNTKQFVIETHSDYLVDRVRMAVAQGQISAESVNIVFLERDGLDVNVHELVLDETGNITNAPNCYRQFFFEEEARLLLRGR